MRFVKILVFIVVLAVWGWGIYNLEKEKRSLNKNVQELSASLQDLNKQNEVMVSQIEYFKNKENLLKEIKSKFNYREAGEGLIIIVPTATSTN